MLLIPSFCQCFLFSHLYFNIFSAFFMITYSLSLSLKQTHFLTACLSLSFPSSHPVSLLKYVCVRPVSGLLLSLLSPSMDLLHLFVPFQTLSVCLSITLHLQSLSVYPPSLSLSLHSLSAFRLPVYLSLCLALIHPHSLSLFFVPLSLSLFSLIFTDDLYSILIFHHLASPLSAYMYMSVCM